jgi:preprotein translocase subunit SecG
VVRIIIALIIIVAVLMLFNQKGATGVGSGGAGSRLTSGGSGSALVPGYRSDPPSGPATTSATG